MKDVKTSTNARAGSKHSFDGGVHELPLARTGLMPSLPPFERKDGSVLFNCSDAPLDQLPQIGKGVSLGLFQQLMLLVP